MKKLILFSVAILFATSAFAQSNNLSASLAQQYKFAWDQPATDLGEALSYTYYISDNGSAPAIILATCSGLTSPFNCVATSSLQFVSKGTHVVTVSANIQLIDNSVLSSGNSNPFTYKIIGAALSPINLNIKKIGTQALLN